MITFLEFSLLDSILYTGQAKTSPKRYRLLESKFNDRSILHVDVVGPKSDLVSTFLCFQFDVLVGLTTPFHIKYLHCRPIVT
jgi:hypothetical protein